MSRTLTAEHRRRISEAHKGLHHSDETKRKLSERNMGHHSSDETRRKISTAIKKLCCTKEHLKKMSESHKGLRHSDETKRMLSEMNKGHFTSEETRRKISETQKGKYIPKETRRKMSAAQKGRYISSEHRRKISVARKRWWGSISIEKRQAVLKNMHRALMGLSPSSLERTMQDHFQKAGVTFETQKEFSPYFVDIWIPELNLVVECDGEYWHGSLKAQCYDRKRDRYLISRYNVRVVRVPEKSIRSNPEQVVSEITSSKLKRDLDREFERHGR